MTQGDYPYDLDVEVEQLRKELALMIEVMIWAPGKIVWDDPASIKTTDEACDVLAAFRRKLEKIQESLTIESAYFVIGDRGVENVKKLIDRGVKVRIMTNSLASNDVLAAHAGHAEYRKQLLQAGAEIYEMRSDSEVIKKTWSGKSMASLHTKAMAFDNETLFIGSFNLDPRSGNLNTEAGLYVESPELAAQVLTYLDEGVLPKNSYHLQPDENDNLVWITIEDGVEVPYDKDPKSTFFQRFTSGFIEMLPVESQL